MNEYLSPLLRSEPLSHVQAREALLRIGRGEANPAQTAAFLTAFALKGLTVDELEGFRAAMLELCLAVDLDEFEPMDVCGTGGDGKDTFNISTTAAFIVAGAGQCVAKHGNHGVSSLVGSSTVLEYLGYHFTNDFDTLRRQLDAAGITYLHAPLFHPAMRHVGPIRKELGFKTFFNLLGPLLNPAHVRRQLAGVYSPAVAELYAGVLRRAGGRFAVVHALDGYDEISLTGDVRVWRQDSDETLSLETLGLGTNRPDELHGGATLEASARVLVAVLSNEGTPAQTRAVLANAALALQAAEPALNWTEAVEKATESLESGRAYASLKRLLA
jgi:anthranilate phosphoribosyltransferase